MSDGSICLISIDATGAFCKTQQWKAHELEAGRSHIIVIKMTPKSGFEMCFCYRIAAPMILTPCPYGPIGSQHRQVLGVPTKTRLEFKYT